MESSDLFTKILDFPVGFDNPFSIRVGDVFLGAFSPGDSVVFSDFSAQLDTLLVNGSGVRAFTATGISPQADNADPQGFPLKLDFSNDFVDFTMTPIHVSEVTGVEPSPGAEGILLAQNHPNPFTARTVIRFELPSPGAVSLGVFDARGALVRVLLPGSEYPAGTHEFVWNGRDAAGRRAPAGIYFYRLSGPWGSESRRMILTP